MPEVDEALPHEEQMDLLDALLGGDADRDDPDEFTGREEELRWLDGKMRRIRPSGGRGRSCVVEGIPGIGKTSLVNQFRYGCAKDGVVSVELEPLQLAHPMNAAIQMANEVLESDRQEDAAAVRKACNVPRGFDVSISVMGSGGRIGRSAGAVAPHESQPYAEGMSLDVAIGMLGIPREVPFVFFVDEAHRLSDSAKGIIASLQLGIPGRRILPVYAGIRGRTANAVNELCSGRLAADSMRNLWLMSDAEVSTSIWRTSRKAGISPDVLGRLADGLAADCGGFARHITAALSGVAEVELALRREGRTIGLEHVHACRKAASVRREHYYAERLASIFPTRQGGAPMGLLIVLAHQAAQDETGLAASHESVRPAYEQALAARKGNKDGLDLESVLTRCEQAGILENGVDEEGGRFFRFLTPSIASYIVREARQKGHRIPVGRTGHGG